jgi:putative acetyltransferase
MGTAVTALVIAIDDPRAVDVRALLEAHLGFAHDTSPPEHVHALGVEGLLDPAVTFFSARRDGLLVGVGALRELDARHGEIKSMHVTASQRGTGIGRAIVDHLITVAAGRGYRRVSLETGTGDAFAPARALYRAVGFAPCEPFGEYTANPYSACMTMELEPLEVPMDAGSIEGAYAPFVAELRRGGFAVPVEGWAAEMVAAHVAHNNELIAAAAESVATGGRPEYRNAVGDDELASYAAAAGGLPGLADAVESSAARLAAAWTALDGEAGEYPMPVLIVDSGQVVRDGPIPVRAFIEGNASFHLEMHLEQLRALRP